MAARNIGPGEIQTEAIRDCEGPHTGHIQMNLKATGRNLISRAGLLVGALVSLAVCAADTASGTPAASVQNLMSRDLAGASGKEVRLLTVEYRGGGASLPHRHDAQVFVYVLAGKVRMQVAGSAEVTLGPGETFYEGPDDIHTVSANASPTEPARILVVMVRDKDKPVSTEVLPKESR
jgi:quercetin dioxygenase-like cupin family protein